MFIGINLKLPRFTAAGGVGNGGPSEILALEPTLFLDFLAGQSGSLGEYQDQSLDLNFVEPQYDIVVANDPAYGQGRYLVAG